ncbi:MAG TPA: DUF3667 domain-containing protein [Cyclobacteriaceae bacterium]|nr:DUF3667 domain-containing protein [Cyclobacteriaceae bacterium]
MKNALFLLVKPGFLVKEFIEGRRRRYMAPFSLFLLINLLYFFISSLSDLNPSLWEQTEYQVYSSWTKTLVQNRLERRQIAFKDYESKYNMKSSELAKTMIVLNVPIFALFIAMLFAKKTYYFADHFIFSLYLFSFVLLTIILSIGIEAVFRTIIGMSIWNIMALPFLGLFMVYQTVALKKVYQQNWFWTLLKSVLLLMAFMITHFFYRFILFAITFAST